MIFLYEQIFIAFKFVCYLDVFSSKPNGTQYKVMSLMLHPLVHLHEVLYSCVNDSVSATWWQPPSRVPSRARICIVYRVRTTMCLVVSSRNQKGSVSVSVSSVSSRVSSTLYSRSRSLDSVRPQLLGHSFTELRFQR